MFGGSSLEGREERLEHITGGRKRKGDTSRGAGDFSAGRRHVSQVVRRGDDGGTRDRDDRRDAVLSKGGAEAISVSIC